MAEQEKQYKVEAQENLVSSGYLHSTTKGFRYFVAASKDYSIFHRSEQHKEVIKEKLKELKKSTENVEREFYSKFGIMDEDIAIAAKRFNTEVLQASMKNYHILKGINTPGFYNEIKSPYTNEDKAELVYKKFNDIEISKKIGPSIIAEGLNKISDILNNTNLYGNTKKHKLKKVYTEKDLKITDAFYKALDKYNPELKYKIDEELNKSDKEYKKNIKNVIKKYLINHGADKKFITLFSKDLDKILSTFKSSQLNNTINQQGMIGEVINMFTLERIQEEISNSLNNKGLAKMAILYTGTAKILDESGKDTGKYAPIDFFMDKFGIQSKNTLNLSNEGFNDIRIADSVSLDTFIQRLSNNKDVGKNAAEQYRYLAQNIAWLRNNSLDRDNLKINEISSIMDFISDILATGARDLLIHNNRAIKINNKKTIKGHYGNVFYFFRTEFLIPVSLMIDGLIDAVDKYQGESIGKFSNSSFSIKKQNEEGQVNIISSGGLDKKEFYNKKIQALKDYDGETNVYRYPENLVAIGSEGGATFRNLVGVSVYYKFNLSNLVKKVESLYAYKDIIK